MTCSSTLTEKPHQGCGCHHDTGSPPSFISHIVFLPKVKQNQLVVTHQSAIMLSNGRHYSEVDVVSWLFHCHVFIAACCDIHCQVACFYVSQMNALKALPWQPCKWQQVGCWFHICYLMWCIVEAINDKKFPILLHIYTGIFAAGRSLRQVCWLFQDLHHHFHCWQTWLSAGWFLLQ